jgi:hypothetical protein
MEESIDFSVWHYCTSVKLRIYIRTLNQFNLCPEITKKKKAMFITRLIGPPIGKMSA